MASIAKHPLSLKLECGNCRDQSQGFYEDFAHGDMVCTSCGMVVGDRIIDTRSEWRTFSNDGGTAQDDPSRVGGPSNPLFDGDQLDTIISVKDGFTGASRELSRLQGRANAKPGEKALHQHFKTIGVLCERIGLTRAISDRAKQLFKLADDERLIRGKGAEPLQAACIYLACKEANVPRTYKEIMSLTMVHKKDIFKAMKALMPYLERMSSPSTEDFTGRFCSHLNLDAYIQNQVLHAVKRVKELGIADGKSPVSVVSACIYLVAALFPALRKQTKDIAFVSGMSEGTIKGTYKELYEYRKELIPADLHNALINLPNP